MKPALAGVALLLLVLGLVEIGRGMRQGSAGLPMVLCGAVAGVVGLVFLIVAALAALH